MSLTDPINVTHRIYHKAQDYSKTDDGLDYNITDNDLD